MIPHPAPPPNLSRREDASPNSSAGPLIGAIFGIAIGIFILSLIFVKILGGLNRFQSNPQSSTPISLRPLTSNANPSNPRPGHGDLRGSGGNNTGGPRRPDVPRAHDPPLMHPPEPGPVPPLRAATPNSDNSGGFPLGPGVYPPGAWPDQANRSIPVEVRRTQRRDPRRSRSEHRP